MDSVSKTVRSEIMAKVKSRGNKSTEWRLRGRLIAAGIRGWRVNAKDLPGTPDLVFDKKRLAIFVDGCFWHGCPKCYRRPKSKRNFWDAKIIENQARDRKVSRALKRSGWSVFRFPECALNRDASKVLGKIIEGLGQPPARGAQRLRGSRTHGVGANPRQVRGKRIRGGG